MVPPIGVTAYVLVDRLLEYRRHIGAHVGILFESNVGVFVEGNTQSHELFGSLHFHWSNSTSLEEGDECILRIKCKGTLFSHQKIDIEFGQTFDALPELAALCELLEQLFRDGSEEVYKNSVTVQNFALVFIVLYKASDTALGRCQNVDRNQVLKWRPFQLEGFYTRNVLFHEVVHSHNGGKDLHAWLVHDQYSPSGVCLSLGLESIVRKSLGHNIHQIQLRSLLGATRYIGVFAARCCFSITTSSFP
mmetsp:Transcript_25108/g.69261  ORF Transcript_25108/g.69261 Transcript_25108/m.69261 type:complete len:248 (+) Transcript_25108:1260-2003(+)